MAAAQAELGARARPGQVARGLTANVAAPGDAARVVAAAQGWLPGGGFDVWISNAGRSHYGLVTQCDDAEVADLVATNLTGTLLCAKHALAALAAQPTGGHLFNMDGAGSDGGATPYFAAYGATKHALTQLHKSLKAELKAGGVTNVGVHRLSPGEERRGGGRGGRARRWVEVRAGGTGPCAAVNGGAPERTAPALPGMFGDALGHIARTLPPTPPFLCARHGDD